MRVDRTLQCSEMAETQAFHSTMSDTKLAASLHQLATLIVKQHQIIVQSQEAIEQAVHHH